LGSSVVIRDIQSLDEVRVVEELQKEIWGLADRDITPLTHLVAVKETGGQLIGAFDGQTLIGFVYGFAAVEGGQMSHHSHMLAVKPSYRNVDVGYRLKLAQRERALAQGITRITWTFDPLQSLNAYFNFCKLGVVSDTYRVDFYGAETSSFLHRIGTDRLWVTWLLESGRVRQRLEHGPPRRLDLSEGISDDKAFIEIPEDINAAQRHHPEDAVHWREATRRAFTEALASGFLVEDFFRQTRGEQSVGVYVLSRGRTIEDLA